MIIISAALFAATVFAAAQDTAPFQWTRLTIDIPSTPGSGFDVYARLLAEYIGKYLPGHPTVIAVNMPGAGGLTMTNYVYNSAPRDGTEIGTSAPSFMMDRLLRGDKSSARFDAMKFNWIGSMNKDTEVLVVTRASGLTLNDILAGKPANMGATGTASNQWTFGRAMNSLLGAKFNLLPEYPGVAEILLAMDRGELDGIPGLPMGTLAAERPNWLSSGEAHIVLQFATSRMKGLPDVPAVLEVIPDEANRQAMNAIILRGVIGRPFYAPPGVPENRVATLRLAFDAAMKSQELQAEAAKLHLDIDPIEGAEVAQIIARLNSPSQEVLKKLQSIFEE